MDDEVGLTKHYMPISRDGEAAEAEEGWLNTCMYQPKTVSQPRPVTNQSRNTDDDLADTTKTWPSDAEFNKI